MPLQIKTCSTIGEAAALLGSDRSARYHAGGTIVMRALNEGDARLQTIVRSSDPALTRIQSSGGRMTLGAGVSMAQILAERDLAFLHPVARAIGGPAIRNAATVGGNLFTFSPYGEFGTALLALDAHVNIVGSFAGGDMPIEQFYANRDHSVAGLIGAISFNRPTDDSFRFRKVTRVRPKGVAVLSIAALLPRSGRITGARVAYNGMAATPIRAHAVERALEGRSLDSNGVTEAVRVAAEGTNPPTDSLASAWYRREVIGVHLRRLLLNEPA